MADDQYHMKFGGSAGASVDDYLEYKRIVGDDDGGNTFSPKQYEDYKKRVTSMRINNRLYVSWTNASGMDCKLVGPETECFCQHRYRQHKTDFATIPAERPILQPCKVRGCKCISYAYIPALHIRCKCKHECRDHSIVEPNKCRTGSCQCKGFRSAYTCGCGEPAYNHKMVVETKEERQERGHPLGQDTIYQAMGGLTGFSSLMDGYMRLDPSGQGPPPLEFLDQAVTSSDNPFLRANVNSIRAHKMAVKASQEEIDADLTERMSAMKQPGESDMDYFERRYQERLKAEKQATKRAVTKKPVPQRPTIKGGPAPGPSSDLGGVQGKSFPKPKK